LTLERKDLKAVPSGRGEIEIAMQGGEPRVSPF